jgi:four helix bundle protein
MDLVDAVYDASDLWPQREQFMLTSQIRRAAVSVPANIAEGHGRNGTAEFVYHLGIAYGSLSEVETLFRVATRRGYQTEETLDGLFSISREVGRLINGLIRAMRSR